MKEKKMAETSKKCIQFLDAKSNKLYKCCLSPEDARRASTDMVFAQHIFNGLIHEEKIKAKINFNEDDFEKDISPLHESTNRSHNIDNAVSSQVSGREGMTNWTQEQTLLLINIYREEYLKIGNGKMLLRKLWQLVADKMRENGYNIPATKCATKMDTLKRQYKKVFDHNKQSGNNLMTYKYFDELDEIFRKQPWITPVAIASFELQDSTFENIDERNSSSDKCAVFIGIESEI
ncbi:uncharacterized protein LOC120357880 [Solenopsis invicta]|nr:uncharacterized protein LOC120357880 [Solenopsis invicta]